MLTKIPSLMLLAVFALTLLAMGPALAADSMDVLESEGIHYPPPPRNNTQEAPVTGTEALPQQSTQTISAHNSKWDDAMYAYGETFLKVTCAIIVLTLISAVKRKTRRKASGVSSQLPDDANPLQKNASVYVINQGQRVLLMATAAIMAAMVCFPPFHIMNNGHEVMALGYHFGTQFKNACIDREMLCIQLLVAFSIGLLGTLILHTRKLKELP